MYVSLNNLARETGLSLDELEKRFGCDPVHYRTANAVIAAASAVAEVGTSPVSSPIVDRFSADMYTTCAAVACRAKLPEDTVERVLGGDPIDRLTERVFVDAVDLVRTQAKSK